MNMKSVKKLAVSVLALQVVLAAAPAFAQAPPAAAPAAPAPGAPVPPPPPPKIQAPRKQEAKPVGESAAAPDIKTIYAFENKMASLSDILATKGKNAKITVVSFINTACASCLEEMVVIKNMMAENAGKILLVAIVTDRSADRIGGTLGKDDSTVYLLDPYFTTPPVFGFKSTPALAIIKDGKVVKLVQGFVPTDEGREELKKLLAAAL